MNPDIASRKYIPVRCLYLPRVTLEVGRPTEAL